MILQVVIDIITGIIETIINIIMAMFPQINLATQITQMLAKILTITTQANNMIHFIIGDFVVVLVPLTLTLLAFKYIAYPILSFIRSIIASGNN